MNEILLAASWFVIGLSTGAIVADWFIIRPLMKQVTFLRGQWIKSIESHADLILTLMGVPKSNFTRESDGSAKSPLSDEFKK